MDTLARLKQKLVMALPGQIIYLTPEESRCLMDNARDPLLQEREKTHGSFAKNAEVSQRLKDVMKQHGSHGLCDIHLEALDMIALKISRVLSGQAMTKDHWDDIAGYAKLGSEACK